MPRYGRDYHDMPRYGRDYQRGRGMSGRRMREDVWNRGMGGMGGGFRSRAWNEGSYGGHAGSWNRGETGPRYDGPFGYGGDVEGSRWGGSERFRGGYGGYGDMHRGDMHRGGIMRGGMVGGYGGDFHGSRAGRGGPGHGWGEDDRDFGDRLRSGWNQLRRGMRGMMGGGGYDRGW